MDGRVTVVMPISEALRYPPDPAESILAQTHQDSEFLIIDDGSSDGSAQYLREIADPRVTVIHQQNMGSGAARNRASSLRLCFNRTVTSRVPY